MFARTNKQIETNKSVQYDLGNGKFARVVMEVQNRKTDRIEIEAQAFEIDANGNFVNAPNGAASRTPGTTHVIATSGIAAGTHALKPAWVKVIGNYDENSLGDNVAKVHGKPEKDGEIGDSVYDLDTGIQYNFTRGLLEDLRQGKCEELLNIINQSGEIAGLDF